MNSIKTEIDSPSIAATVALTLRSHQLKGKVLIDVEGPDDVEFYGQYLNHSVAQIQSLGGCSHFEEILNEFGGVFSDRYIIIKDADFDHLNQKRYSSNDLFLTDAHDYEMMILEDSVISKICLNHAGVEDMALLCNVMNNIKMLSFIKWYNNKHNLGVTFDKGFNIRMCYDGINPIDLSQCLTVLQNIDCNKNIPLPGDYILEFIKNNPNPDLAQLTNGHDVCKCVMIALKKKRNKNYKKSELKSAILSGYSLQKFQQTRLYATVNSWSNRNGYVNIFQ